MINSRAFFFALEETERTLSIAKVKIPYTGDEISYYIATMDILREALSRGILDLTVIERQVDRMKRQEYLNKHSYRIYQDKNGRWCTYLPGRKRIQRKDKESLEDALVE